MRSSTSRLQQRLPRPFVTYVQSCDVPPVQRCDVSVDLVRTQCFLGQSFPFGSLRMQQGLPEALIMPRRRSLSGMTISETF